MQGTGKRPDIKFAPREDFEKILEWGVIPTFDLVVELPNEGGIVIVHRIIAPYRNLWALPGLRMFKPESIDDVLARVAEDELGIEIDLGSKRFLGQYVGRFTSEHGRQDLSSGYVVRASSSSVTCNPAHFSSFRVIAGWDEVPVEIGSMYRYYLSLYFGRPPGDNYDKEPSD